MAVVEMRYLRMGVDCRVRYGIYDTFITGGHSVGVIRQMVIGWGMPAHAKAVINGQWVPEGRRVRGGETLEFLRA